MSDFTILLVYRVSPFLIFFKGPQQKPEQKNSSKTPQNSGYAGQDTLIHQMR